MLTATEKSPFTNPVTLPTGGMKSSQSAVNGLKPPISVGDPGMIRGSEAFGYG
jgi:hypothetical protein